MKNTPRIKSIYAKIQTQLFYMIPEKWDKIYLYASIVEKANNIQTGEMFFYYFPKGILKRNPINVYEIPYIYNIEEEAYNTLTNKLYDTIKELRREFEKEGLKLWSNLTISIANLKFNIEYDYEDLNMSKYTNEERHIIWNYKYLDFPIERLSKKDRKMLENYLIEEKLLNKEVGTYSEGMYNFKVHNIIEYNREEYNLSNDNENDNSENDNSELDDNKAKIGTTIKKKDKELDFETRHKKLDKYELYKRQKEANNKENRKIEEVLETKNIERNEEKPKIKSQILNF